jgi:hypothetical protein
MCIRCAREKGSVVKFLQPFLAEGVTVIKINNGTSQSLVLQKGDQKLELKADGDEGGYFHW